MYCKKCGGKIESYASHCPFCGDQLATNNVQATYTTANGNQPVEKKSVLSWILTYIVLCIPIVGFIVLLVWSFGDGTKSNPTFRNWAKSQLLLIVLGAILSVGSFIIFADKIFVLVTLIA